MGLLKSIYKKLRRNLYLYYCTPIFGINYLIFHILFFEPFIHIKRLQYYTSLFNRIWARITFFMWCLPFKIIKEDPNEKRAIVIYAANHFSFFDIPLLCHLPRSFRFVGKMQISKAPLFGRMFKYLHIAFDRRKRKDAFTAFQLSIDTLKEGRSVLFFPEGGIVYKQIPQMGSLKDGAFKVAITTQTPIVPLSVINSKHVMPAKQRLEFYYCPVKIFIHKAIEVKGKTLDDLDDIKEQYRNIVQKTLDKHYERKTH